MIATEPITSGEPSSSETLPEYLPIVRSKNCFHEPGFSFTRSVRYVKPVVPQSFGTDHLLCGSYGWLRNFVSRFRVAVGSFAQSIGCSRFAPARIETA